eukprot:scaffold7473_cov185-Alexandrium_tamarense.AAC.3
MEFLRITMSSLVIGYDEDTGGGIGLSFHCSIGEASVGEFVHNSTSVPTLDIGSSSIRVALSPLSLGKFIDKKSFPESCERKYVVSPSHDVNTSSTRTPQTMQVTVVDPKNSHQI